MKGKLLFAFGVAVFVGLCLAALAFRLTNGGRLEVSLNIGDVLLDTGYKLVSIEAQDYVADNVWGGAQGLVYDITFELTSNPGQLHICRTDTRFKYQFTNGIRIEDVRVMGEDSRYIVVSYNDPDVFNSALKRAHDFFVTTFP